MLKRVIMLLLAISLVLILVAQPSAKVCVARLGNTCLLWSGSWICEIAATGLGDCENKYLGCDIKGTGNWLALCGAPGNENVAPGQNIFYFEGEAGGSIVVDPDTCGDNNGKYTGTVRATIDEQTKINMLAAGACANPNWEIVDAISEFVNLTDYEYEPDNDNICKNDDFVIVATATFDCELPDIRTLGYMWLEVEERWAFEERQYNCTRIDYEVYKTPQCPSDVLGQ